MKRYYIVAALFRGWHANFIWPNQAGLFFFLFSGVAKSLNTSAQNPFLHIPMEGESQPPLMVELAKSNRSTCRKCKVSINKGELRIGKRYVIPGKTQAHFGYRWFHARPDCHLDLSFQQREDILSISGLDQLDDASQKHLRAIYVGDVEPPPPSPPPTPRPTTASSCSSWTCPQCQEGQTDPKPHLTHCFWKITCQDNECRHSFQCPALPDLGVSCGQRACLKKAQLVLHQKLLDAHNIDPPLGSCDRCGSSDLSSHQIVREITSKKHHEVAFKAWRNSQQA